MKIITSRLSVGISLINVFYVIIVNTFIADPKKFEIEELNMMYNESDKHDIESILDMFGFSSVSYLFKGEYFTSYDS